MVGPATGGLLVILMLLDMDLPGDVRVVQVVGHRGVQQGPVFQRGQDRTKTAIPSATGPIVQTHLITSQ